MLDPTSLILLLGIIVVATPLALVCVLGMASLLEYRIGEEAISRFCQGAMVLGLLASTSILALMLIHGTRHEAIELGNWVVIPHFHFSLKLVFDRLSVPLAILSFLLCGTIAAFATRYMHKERGYNRFFMLYALFVLGMVLTSLAGTIETLFAGWELVGLSSVLLVGFFHERPAPVENALRVWIVYRVSDVALLLAAVVMHQIRGEGDFDQLLGAGSWPQRHLMEFDWQLFTVGCLLVIAAAGKSALVPFSGWLPRAMEGPTPSSAIFYGALSVHLGAFLLLRISPILETSIWLSAAVVVLGLTTALVAYLSGSVQTDIKSALCFASLVQVGLIVAEIGLGLRYLALVHLLGNACLRTLQFIRAPTLLHDYHLLENAMGAHLPASHSPVGRASERVGGWLYRFALERGYLDSLLTKLVVAPFVHFFAACDALERRWIGFVNGGQAREPALLQDPASVMEELP